MSNVHLNPMYYLKHAWDATNSFWGKLAIILFYTFIWFQIVWAIQCLIAPSLGFECFYDAIEQEYARIMATNFVREMNVFVIGFYLYADRGGIRSWNAFMVVLVNAGFSILAAPFRYTTLLEETIVSEGCDAQEVMHSLSILLWVTNAWPVAALLAAWMDERMAPASSTGERTPLTA